MSEQANAKPKNPWVNTIIWMVKMIVLFNIFAIGIYFALRHFEIV